MRNAVQYKGEWLSKNSDAYKLYEAQEWKKLDEHMKLVNQQFIALHGLEKEKKA